MDNRITISYLQYPISWFLESTPRGSVTPPARYRGRNDATAMVTVPEYQRQYVWKHAKQMSLIDTVYRGYPIPAILVTQDHQNRYSIQDGQQRLETFYRFYSNQFQDADGKHYRDLADDQKRQFLGYMIPIIDITGASREDESSIYDRLNQGVALSHGEKLFNQRATAIVNLTERLLMKRGEGLNPLAVQAFDDYLRENDTRYGNLCNAVAYVAGAALSTRDTFYITTSYDKLANNLNGVTRDGQLVRIDEELAQTRLEILLNIYIDADEAQPTCSKKKKAQWKIGLFSAFILHSIILNENNEEMLNHVRDTWVEFLRRDRLSDGNTSHILMYGVIRGGTITKDRLDKVYGNFKRMMEGHWTAPQYAATHDSDNELEDD